MSSSSIFATYYTKPEFIDRYLHDPVGITVIIPVIHTNELWEVNLLSIYREIPVAELIIADGGCIDNSIEIAMKFPRVRIEKHHQYKTLGFSIKASIETVKTDWFAYLHSDVFLPSGWWDKMKKHKSNYEWFGCRMQHTVMVEYDLDYGERPYAGAQIGKTANFSGHMSHIDDDYVYRQEDFVFSDVVKNSNGREGKINDVFHYHQTMHKDSPTGRKVKSLKIDMSMNDSERLRTADQQLKGIVKYLKPNNPWLIESALGSFIQLLSMKKSNFYELRRWILETDPAWWPVIRNRYLKFKIKNLFLRLIKRSPAKS
jgi:glycosyltransferase involved in cell wall biosynthesis